MTARIMKHRITRARATIAAGTGGGPAALLEGAVDRRRVPKVDLDSAAQAGVDRSVVQVDDLGSKVTNDLGRSGTHTSGTSDYQRPLAVVAELLDTSHVIPLLGRQQ